MSFLELKNDFSLGKISKADYIQAAHSGFHAHLFDFSRNLPQTDIREISITDRGVVFTVRSSGVKFYGQPHDHRCPPIETYNFSDFEPAESKMMRKLFDGFNTFYDVGANIGWHSLNLASLFRDAEFFCFEPIPTTFQQLNANISLNAFSSISAFNVALSDRDEKANFFYYEACSGNASAENLSNRDDVRVIECNLVKLDEFIPSQGLPPPHFVKCDVEGAELHVLLGGAKTIQTHHPIILAEVLRKWSARFQYDPNDIFKLLSSFGYNAYTTNGRYLKPFMSMTEDTPETNFFFLHPVTHQERIRQFVVP